ncbi:MAG TPA: hypothetical protein VFK89_08705, partial [Actinomycetota bacterium]|nr:hypothetical protein [Actinomycetota bacterium]
VPSSSDADLAQVLERLDGKRFGGLDISFSASDHAATEPSTVGLWTVPSSADDLPNDHIPTDLFWVPLDRTFTGRGTHTSVLRPDLPYLFPRAALKGGRIPSYRRSRFGITTPSRDPIH